MSEETPWPRKGDTLFSNRGDWWNACIAWSGPEWHGYAEGYRLGAELLVRQVGETFSKQDYLVYPIIFLYRQALEVSLKHLLLKGCDLLDQEPVRANHHRLVALWRHCRPMIEEVWPDGSKEELDAVGEVLAQFEAKDPGSTVFRYPVTTAGEKSIAGSEKIDILNFAEVAERTFAFLDACGGAFSQYLEDRASGGG